MKKRIINENKIRFELDFEPDLLKFISKKYAIEDLIKNYTLEWRNNVERNEEREFFGKLGDIFSDFLELWSRDLYSIKNYPQFIRMCDLVPLINPHDYRKYLSKFENGEIKQSILSNFLNPTDINNEFYLTLYYPFPIISALTDHNHTLLLMYFNGIKNNKYLNNVLRTKKFVMADKIIKNISFKKDKMILENIEQGSDLRCLFYFKKYPLLINIIFNSIFNKEWNYKTCFSI